MILPFFKLLCIIFLPIFMYCALNRLGEIKNLLSQILVKLENIDKDNK